MLTIASLAPLFAAGILYVAGPLPKAAIDGYKCPAEYELGWTSREYKAGAKLDGEYIRNPAEWTTPFARCWRESK